MDVVEKKVAYIVAYYSGLSFEAASACRDLQKAGVTGDDAYELLERVGNEFDIDWTGFEWDRHFGNEGLDLVGLVRRWRHGRKWIPVATCDLVEAARAKKWMMRYEV